MIKSIAIGSFDGMHIAHKRLEAKADALVIIERNCGLLTAGYKRSLYTSRVCCFYHFDIIKELTPFDFVEKLKVDFPYLESIVVGYDFRFGRDKLGDANILRQLYEKEVIIVDEVSYEDIPIHSRTIKSYLRDGNIDMSNNLLGRRYTIQGDIIRGQGIGKKELFATINLSIEEYQLPKDGVYATHTNIDGIWYDSVSFLGHRESTDGYYAVESHILDRDIGEVSGVAEIRFVSFIRDNQKFDSLTLLKNQIKSDIVYTKGLLSDI